MAATISILFKGSVRTITVNNNTSVEILGKLLLKEYSELTPGNLNLLSFNISSIDEFCAVYTPKREIFRHYASIEQAMEAEHQEFNYYYTDQWCMVTPDGKYVYPLTEDIIKLDNYI